MKNELPKIDYRFTAALESNATYNIFLTVPKSKEILGTGKTVKVGGTIDGQPFQATLMPSGEGLHWLPLRIAIRKLIGKNQAGEQVRVHLTERFS